MGVLGCDEPATEAPRPPAPEERPPARACELEEPSAFAGEPIALAPSAMVVRDGETLRLLRLDEPGRATTLDVRSVARRGVVARASSHLVLAQTAEGPGVLVIRGEEVQRIPLAQGTLVEGALAARGAWASAAWVDDAGALRVARLDLQHNSASEPEVLATIEEGAPLVASTRSGAIVSWTGRGASLFTLQEGSSRRTDAPGLVLDLLSDAERVGILHEGTDRTGAWLTVPLAPAVRVTRPEARPQAPSIAPIHDGSVVVYREAADVFMQRLGEDAIPRGGPVVVGSSAPGAPESAPLLAADGARVWIAWQSAGETGPEARVRSARCP